MKALLEKYCGILFGNPYICLLVLLLAGAAAVWAAGMFSASDSAVHRNMYVVLLMDNNVCVGALAGFVLYLVLLPLRRAEAAAVCILGCLLEAYLMSLRSGYITEAARAVYLHYVLFGLGLFGCSIAAVGLRLGQSVASGDTAASVRCWEVLGLMLALPAFYLLGICGGIKGGSGEVYDGFLLAADGLTGFQPSFVISAFVRRSSFFLVAMCFVYLYLPMWMALAQLASYKYEMKREEDCRRRLSGNIPAYAYLLAGIAGSLAYAYFPAVGTEVFCGASFPFGPVPDSLSRLYAAVFPAGYERNAMPSLHLTWILCAFFSVYNFGFVYRSIWGVLVVLTLISAFSVGCHWMTDFIAALPFTCMILGAACHRAHWRWRLAAVFFGGIGSFGLMYLLKNHIHVLLAHSALYFAAAVGTALLSLALCVRLQRVAE